MNIEQFNQHQNSEYFEWKEHWVLSSHPCSKFISTRVAGLECINRTHETHDNVSADIRAFLLIPLMEIMEKGKVNTKVNIDDIYERNFKNILKTYREYLEMVIKSIDTELDKLGST